MTPAVLDTSILLRLANSGDPKRALVLRSLDRLSDEGRSFALFPQVLAEFYVVATRPIYVNGLGLAPTETDAQIGDFLVWCDLQGEDPRAFPLWRRLVRETDTVGKRAHDARLTASLLAAGLDSLVTLNPKDFLRFQVLEGIELELIVPV